MPDWWLTKDGDKSCLELYERHYSCYKYKDGRERFQFVGPGASIVLRTARADALFVWRDYIDHTIPKQEGIECAVFRNEGRILSSKLIRQADAVADCAWPGQRHYTKVDPEAVGSGLAGYCFLRAGWRRCGMTKGGLQILERRPRPIGNNSMTVQLPPLTAEEAEHVDLAKATQKPDDIVGHKTFDTGKKDRHGLPIFRHEPLTRAEGDALWAACEAAQAKRAADMPDEQSALSALQHAYTRLTELGWRDAVYSPKDGSMFKVIEAGSTGIFDANYWGKWPDGGWHVFDADDIYPSRPILFKLLPEDQAKYDAKMKAAAERWKAERDAETSADMANKS